MRPRITIYAFSDTTYSTQLYTYNGFSDVGSTAKPISLTFEGTTTGAGSFSIEIEDSDGTLDPEMFIKGNRVFIECSKDGVTWQAAFKGLVRSCERYLVGAVGSTYTISGYSYLVRFNERIVNFIKQSALTGTVYNRADSTMFTNNLINDLLTNDADYVYSVDDTQLYSLFKTNNLTSSPIADWVPRLDAQLVSVSDAINSVLDFSTAIVTLDPSNDQLVLFDPQQPATTGTGIFLVTDQPNLIADNGAYTMYPVEPYKYNVSYDYPDSGSRLIANIGLSSPSPECPTTTIDTGGGGLTDPYDSTKTTGLNGDLNVGSVFDMSNNILTGFTLPVMMQGNMSTSNHTDLWVFTWYVQDCPACQSGLGEYDLNLETTNRVGPLPLYLNGIPSTPYPSSPPGAAGTSASILSLKLQAGTQQTLPLAQAKRSLTFNPDSSITDSGYMFLVHHPGPQDASNRILLIGQYPYSGWLTSASSASPPVFGGNGQMSWNGGRSITDSVSGSYYRCAGNSGGSTTLPACGGLPAVTDADPVFAVAQDKNMSKRIGAVERVISDLPPSVRTAQTMNEFLFAKLYTASKPRFTFDFPAVTIPNNIPKAGDLVAHACKKASVGTKSSPIQTGVILNVNYDFRQDDEGVMGLTKMALQTTGIRRGYY